MCANDSRVLPCVQTTVESDSWCMQPAQLQLKSDNLPTLHAVSTVSIVTVSTVTQYSQHAAL